MMIKWDQKYCLDYREAFFRLFVNKGNNSFDKENPFFEGSRVEIRRIKKYLYLANSLFSLSKLFILDLHVKDRLKCINQNTDFLLY